ncbi:hypothetical protein HUT16_33500 [Kitasatospora sp. NA04385]|uniref:hypothetical protein n=1 Tax=Kitasatospora sp. NA04385 TaxID=2742135 RepID=UPI001591FF13|nr:hypothetical protein [Kitasatospora sp. NA04385]QKW23353.1 hypothetical protein HUT16_33500 [Kitasatospora sp. NA04385]
MELTEHRPVAPRMLLARRIERWFVLERPVFIPAGCRFWTERDALVVEHPTGERRRYAGFVCR